MNQTNEPKPSFFHKMDPKYTIIAILGIALIIFVLYKTKKPRESNAVTQWQQYGDGMQKYLEGVGK